MAIERKCGDCGTLIPGDLEMCPKCPPRRPRKKAEVVPALLVFALLGSSFLMLSSSVVNVVNAPAPISAPAEAPAIEDRTVAAYEAAKNFVQQRFPGEKKFSELYQSKVQQEGNNYVVLLTADDFSGPTPARASYTVELEFSGDASWALKQISQ